MDKRDKSRNDLLADQAKPVPLRVGMCEDGANTFRTRPSS